MIAAIYARKSTEQNGVSMWVEALKVKLADLLKSYRKVEQWRVVP